MVLKSPHVHRDFRVTVNRVDAFGEPPREEQIVVLAELRRLADDDSNDVQTTIMIAIASVVRTIVVAPRLVINAAPGSAAAWAYVLASGTVAAIVVSLVLLPVIVSAFVRGVRREGAKVWLGTHEAELQRRWQISGRAAHRWRRTH